MGATIQPYLYQDLDYLGSAADYVGSVSAAIGMNSLYESISEDDCNLLCQFMHCFTAPQGAELLTEGVEGDYLLFILEGSLHVSKRDLAGRPVTLAIVEAGSVLGEMSLLDGEHRFATCTAAEPVKFAVLTRADLNEILFVHPRLGNKLLVWILQITIGRIRDADMQLLTKVLPPIA